MERGYLASVMDHAHGFLAAVIDAGHGQLVQQVEPVLWSAGTDLLGSDDPELRRFGLVLALAPQIAHRIEHDPNAVEVVRAVEHMLTLSMYGDADLRERFPHWQPAVVLGDNADPGLAALGLLTQLALLVQAPDLVIECLRRAQRALHTLLLSDAVAE